MTPILVCESVRAATIEELVRARDAAVNADLVELRLDGLSQPDAGAALAGRTRPVIVTCRPRWEGGGYDGDEEARLRLLEQALRAGADFVDLEWAAPGRDVFLGRWRERIVLSLHDFDGMPADLASRGQAMCDTGAAVVKIAATSRRLRDLEPLLALRRVLPRDRRVVLIGMGPAGAATRLLPQRFGSCWTYGGLGVAPGQMSVDRLVREFRVRTITSRTAVFGVAGRPVTASASPAIHNAAFAACGMDAVCVPFEAADFADFAWAADTLHVAGAGITAPLDADAFRAATSADGQATVLGVANVLRRDGQGTWSARNTELDGFLAPIVELPLNGARVSVLGAGCAARTVVAALAGRGAAVTVHARRIEAAREVSARFETAVGAWPPPPGSWDLLVNTTPVGMWPRDRESPVEESLVKGGTVYDLVYNPPETRLLQAARRNGCPTIGGLEMVVQQAARQFEWWTGRPAPVAAMREGARSRMEEFRREAGTTGTR